MATQARRRRRAQRDETPQRPVRTIGQDLQPVIIKASAKHTSQPTRVAAELHQEHHMYFMNTTFRSPVAIWLTKGALRYESGSMRITSSLDF